MNSYVNLNDRSVELASRVTKTFSPLDILVDGHLRQAFVLAADDFDVEGRLASSERIGPAQRIVTLGRAICSLGQLCGDIQRGL